MATPSKLNLDELATHAGTFLLSINEARVLARLKNEAQYRDVLR